MSDRLAAIMRPSQAKKDEDVMYEVKKWLDDARECLAMGATEFAFDHKIIAIRMIATESIREKMDFADARIDPTDKEERYKNQYVTMNRCANLKVRERGMWR